jgi:hypothetical protein
MANGQQPGQIPQVGQLPISMDPATLARLAVLVQPQGAGQQPPPISPSVTQTGALGQVDPLLNAVLESSRQGMAGTQARLASGEQVSQGTLQGPLAAETALAGQKPQAGFEPRFGGGFLHNLGQALLAFGASTAPGESIQNVVYGNRLRDWSQKMGALKSLVDQRQAQQTLEQAPITPLAGEATHPFYGGGRIMGGAAELQEIQLKSSQIANENWARIQSTLQNEQKIGLQATQQQVEQVVSEIAEQAREYAADRGVDEAQIMAGVRAQLGNLTAQTDVQKLHPWLTMDWIDQLLGGKPTTAPQVPGAAPATGAAVPPARPAPRTAAPQQKQKLPAGAIPGTLNGVHGYVLNGQFHKD